MRRIQTGIASGIVAVVIDEYKSDSSALFSSSRSIQASNASTIKILSTTHPIPSFYCKELGVRVFAEEQEIPLDETCHQILLAALKKIGPMTAADLGQLVYLWERSQYE